jgi:hypothetical protein
MGKKEKKDKKKSKSVSFQVKTYSTIYSTLFNSQKYSDLTIKTEKGTSFYAHKFILSSSSKIFHIFLTLGDVFSEKVMDENVKELTVNEENEELFKDFLKFLYTGGFDVSSEEKTFGFFLLLGKVFFFFEIIVQS